MGSAMAVAPESQNDVSRVTKALERPDYVWRTFDGLQTETQLPEDKLLTILHNMPDDKLVTTVGKQGRLYTTRQHYNEKQSFLGKFLSAVTGKLK